MKRLLRLSVGAADTRRDVERELRAHIEQRTEELIRAGSSPAEARRMAESDFGDFTGIATECAVIRRERDRERRRRGMGDALAQDLRYSARLLRRTPGFTVVSLLTLALGIGATTALFSVVYALLLRPLPFPEDERLVRVGEGSAASGESGWSVSIPLGEDLALESRTLEAGGIRLPLCLTVRLGAEAQQVRAMAMSAGAFAALGVQPAVGRLPSGSEYGQTSSRVVVISHVFWQRYFGGAPDVIGRTVQLSNDALPVIGVMPPSFAFPNADTEVWLPLFAFDARMRNRAVHVTEFVGRLREDVSIEQARAELQGIYERGQRAEPASDAGHRIEVIPLRTWLVGDSRGAVLILFGAVALVLLVACANLAGLQLARVAARGRELAVRAALGAGRWAVLRQPGIEAVLLGVMGCALGAALAPVLQSLIVSAYPGGLPLTAQIRIDARVLLFAIGATLLAVVLFGVLPAFHALRMRPVTAVQSGLLRVTDGAGRQRARRALVVVEVALAVVLALGGALVARSFARVSSKPSGFDANQLLVLNVSVSSERRTDAEVIQFYQALPERLAAVPGVSAVGGSSALPMTGGDSHGDLTIDGRVFNAGSAPSASYRRVLPNYFRTMGVPLVAGREFDARDQGTGPFVVIVNETLARRHFGEPAAAIGQRIKVGVPDNEPWLTIVGVVGDVRNESLEANDEHATYEPHPQRAWRSMQLVVRTSVEPMTVAPALRAKLRELDPYILISELGTMEDRIAGSLAPRRFNTQLLVGFALLALFLASLGIYGVTAHGVNERRRELGIRIAVGASAGEIRRLVIGQCAMLAALGTLIGLLAALGLTRLVRGMLYEVSTTDPLSLAATIVALGAVTLVAGYLPARKAARTDPARVLRE